MMGKIEQRVEKREQRRIAFKTDKILLFPACVPWQAGLSGIYLSLPRPPDGSRAGLLSLLYSKKIYSSTTPRIFQLILSPVLT